ncbi:uncharacterized protein LOC144370552 [Ictidomys tridecemlineatus]
MGITRMGTCPMKRTGNRGSASWMHITKQEHGLAAWVLRCTSTFSKHLSRPRGKEGSPQGSILDLPSNKWWGKRKSLHGPFRARGTCLGRSLLSFPTRSPGSRCGAGAPARQPAQKFRGCKREKMQLSRTPAPTLPLGPTPAARPLAVATLATQDAPGDWRRRCLQGSPGRGHLQGGQSCLDKGSTCPEAKPKGDGFLFQDLKKAVSHQRKGSPSETDIRWINSEEQTDCIYMYMGSFTRKKNTQRRVS